MNIIISCHIDSVFKEPFCRVFNNQFIGACDNFAPVMAVAQLINKEGIHIEFTEEEEMHMDGARYVAKRNNPEDTFIIVMDCTDRGKNWDKINFTIENWNSVQVKHIKKALRNFNYKLKEKGTESEAWLYKEFGYACLEIDIPVIGGLHNLQGRARIEDILKVGQALEVLIDYFKDKDRSIISDSYKPGEDLK